MKNKPPNQINHYPRVWQNPTKKHLSNQHDKTPTRVYQRNLGTFTKPNILGLKDLLNYDFKKIERDTNVKIKGLLANLSEIDEKSRSRAKSKLLKKKPKAKFDEYHLKVGSTRTEGEADEAEKIRWNKLGMKKDQFNAYAQKSLKKNC